MHPPGADTVLLRHGEVNTKSRQVQLAMERRLVENVRAILADRGVDGDVERRWTRPLIHVAEEDVEAATAAASDVFGVVSASPALVVDADRAAIKSALVRTAKACYTGGSFAIDARRAGDTTPFDSEDIGEFGGSAVWDAVSERFDPEVDLDDPDLTFYVECRKAEAFVFVEKREGPRGLPIGTQEPLVTLISGGIDSPVAAYEVMRRGAPIIPVYLDLGDYGGVDHRERAIESVRTLARYSPNHSFDLRIVDAGATVSHLAETIQEGRMLTFRRYMYQVGETIAKDRGAMGIVTGEAIGQKSSQTTANMGVTSQAVDLPVHRPLLIMDKEKIVERARTINTFDTATISAGCNRFAPEQAETHGSIDQIRRLEPDDLLERAQRDARAADLLELGR
ncbi:tRNA sulfurtransferase [Natranaeroarchaeum sulfidigenes]|uniref:Probable tRNA sulfurtransferase n=1 Tax=Natranaeroarchaeum sulfidigenes TaxID=2784880 RepID=A0A897MXK6_9EURY|nr:tRNA sulfurtransferase [Natranaeroarchaeum sulfidigenes]QSG03065.1 tRNA S(4)U 4-thiouridine synthase [Natranaeroarchaeum sulfidigenes]